MNMNWVYRELRRMARGCKLGPLTQDPDTKAYSVDAALAGHVVTIEFGEQDLLLSTFEFENRIVRPAMERLARSFDKNGPDIAAGA